MQIGIKVDKNIYKRDFSGRLIQVEVKTIVFKGVFLVFVGTFQVGYWVVLNNKSNLISFDKYSES